MAGQSRKIWLTFRENAWLTDKKVSFQDVLVKMMDAYIVLLTITQIATADIVCF